MSYVLGGGMVVYCMNCCSMFLQEVLVMVKSSQRPVVGLKSKIYFSLEGTTVCLGRDGYVVCIVRGEHTLKLYDLGELDTQ